MPPLQTNRALGLRVRKLGPYALQASDKTITLPLRFAVMLLVLTFLALLMEVCFIWGFARSWIWSQPGPSLAAPHQIPWPAPRCNHRAASNEGPALTTGLIKPSADAGRLCCSAHRFHQLPHGGCHHYTARLAQRGSVEHSDLTGSVYRQRGRFSPADPVSP